MRRLRRNPDLRPSPHGKQLAGMDLSGGSLLYMDLIGADLAGAKLRRTKLTGSGLSGADLSGADLTGAWLEGADLSGANLSGANFSGAHLKGAKFVGANFTHVNLSGADLSGVNLNSVTLRGVDLSKAKLEAATLKDADLRGATLAGAVLSRANLTGANLAGADLNDARGSGVDLRHSDLSGANLSGTRLGFAYLMGANLSGSNLTGASVISSFLTSANLTDANLVDSDFEKSDLDGANLTGVIWADAELSTAKNVPPLPNYVPRVGPLKEHYTLQPPDSSAFKRWFGESVVVGDDKKPVVVYHGTNNGGFTQFDPTKLDAHHNAFYFADNLTVAETYVDRRLPKKRYDPAVETDEGSVRYRGHGIYRLYIKLVNPMIIEGQGSEWYELSDPRAPDLTTTYDLAQWAQEHGHDGVIFKDIRDDGTKSNERAPVATVYAVFDPRAIKSATANNGNYDPNDPDIRHNPRRPRRR